MNKNVGGMDKNIRLVAGIILLVVGLFTSLWWLDLIGVILVGTALMNFCPFYIPLKIDTNKKSASK
ncbi:MAG: DUF2892 domain-containing protein [Ignavibacteriales bacterium]|jgi:hypothetical protein|nr:DUF2892 domain-containing protein [Ignavibacteriales bacterium]MBK7981348.1 DUF2892 domain-containing protein [Ignavibacteriota bacterium]